MTKKVRDPRYYYGNLSDQPGIDWILHEKFNQMLYAYKLVTEDGCGPWFGPASRPYKVGKTYEVKRVNRDPHEDCGKGLNVATLEWCVGHLGHSCATRILEVEFKASDVACVPYCNGDGKFRVTKFKVVRELVCDLDTSAFTVEGWK